MNLRRRRHAAASLLAAGLLLAGCSGRLDAPDGAVLSGDPIPQGWLAEAAEVVPLDRGRSRIAVRVYRAGRLARLGHNHLVEVIELDGELRILPTGGGVARLVFRPDRMRVDDPAARSRAGAAFSQMPDDAAVEGTRSNMLGSQVLDAAAWPQARVLARIDDLGAAQPQAEVHLSLRGVGRRYRLPVTVERTTDRLSVSGSLQLRQSDFGIVPFSVMGGALQVRDVLDVDFHVAGRVSGPALW